MLLRRAINDGQQANAHPSGLRPAATLTEVLVAIFIMGIGLLALLSLFPLGALTMAQAIKDDRTALSAKNAFAIAETFNIHNDPLVQNVAWQNLLGVTVFPGGPMSPPNSPTYFLNPYPGLPELFIPPQQPQYLAPDLAAPSTSPIWLPLAPVFPQVVTYNGASYPIYVDPFGCKYFASLGTAVGLPFPTVGNAVPPIQPNPPGNPPVFYSSIPRLPLSGLLTTAGANQWLDRWCTLPDDINFADNATPSLSTGAVQREYRYSWAWLLRRPKATDPTVVDVTVVVYSGRSLISLGETPFVLGVDPNTGALTNFVRFDPNFKFVDIAWQAGQDKPAVRRGSWILDATMEFFDQRNNVNLNTADPHGFFYRVVEVTDLGGVGPNTYAMRLELQTYPKKASYYVDPNTQAQVPYGVLVVMENVAEVFEKGQGWKP